MTKAASTIEAFAAMGVAQMVAAMVVLWFVTGYLIRFRGQFISKQTVVYSVIACLFSAFIQGCVRSFVLTNVIANSQSILSKRCTELFSQQIFILQLNQLFMYTYLLSRVRMLNLLQTPVYYFLLLLVSFSTLFTTMILPWYNVGTVYIAEESDSDLMMCINGDFSDHNISDEYSIFLSIDAIAQCILLTVFLYTFCTECGYGNHRMGLRVLFIAMIAVVFNLSEFIIFCVSQETIHAVRFIVYSVLIFFSFNIGEINPETGDVNCCCWCVTPDIGYNKPTEQDLCIEEDNIAAAITESKLMLPMAPKVSIEQESSSGLLQ